MVISLKAVSSYCSVTFICPVLELEYLISETLWCQRMKLALFFYFCISLTFFLSGRGGQSALRFARLRMEKRHNYVRKVAETAVQLFVSNDKVNVAGLVLAGSADFKTELSQSDMFDPVCARGHSQRPCHSFLCSMITRNPPPPAFFFSCYISSHPPLTF